MEYETGGCHISAKHPEEMIAEKRLSIPAGLVSEICEVIESSPNIPRSCLPSVCADSDENEPSPNQTGSCLTLHQRTFSGQFSYPGQTKVTTQPAHLPQWVSVTDVLRPNAFVRPYSAQLLSDKVVLPSQHLHGHRASRPAAPSPHKEDHHVCSFKDLTRVNNSSLPMTKAPPSSSYLLIQDLAEVRCIDSSIAQNASTSLTLTLSIPTAVQDAASVSPHTTCVAIL